MIVERFGPDRLRIYGAEFDFGSLSEGDLIPADAIPCGWILGPVERVDGEIQLTLMLPYGTSPDAHVAFPAPIIGPPLGVVDLPFSTWCETSESPVEGGVEVTTTTHRWQQAVSVAVEFIPEPVFDQAGGPVEEVSHVEP